MQYDPEIGFKILKSMEIYPESAVPSPFTALDEDTGLPPKPEPIDLSDLSKLDLVNTPVPYPGPLPERFQTPERTHPRSWIGEMDYEIFMAHAGWMKQERLITTSDRAGYPRELTIKGVQLLKEVEAKGGWDKALDIVAQAKAATTLTSICEVLRKAKSRD